ncbi:MAG: MFS transporter [Pseudomonadota bacterium]
MQHKPRLSFWQIWNMCFGFLGIQFGFALQNANVSRIFQTLGASVDELPILWVAAPLTGLIVQPIVGYFSDRTWTRLGRRRPYFLVGAILASAALIAMPNSPTLWFAAGMLWIMDASINVSMEPFRAFVGDMLPEPQRTSGFAMQSFFIGIGAIVASALPWMFTNWFGVVSVPVDGQVPDAVKWSFYLGAAAFFLAVLWTVITTKEYTPEQVARFEAAAQADAGKHQHIVRAVSAYWRDGGICLLVGIALLAWVVLSGLDQQLYILGGMVTAFGVLQWVTAALQARGAVDNGVVEVVTDLFNMPRAMKQLAVVQFFSWFALFAMWIYGTSAVTSFHFGATDPASLAYNEGADWVGVLFGAYNGFAALAAIAIPRMAGRLGCRVCHLINLCLGGVGLISFYFITDPVWLLVSMVGVGIAWASILSLPYALLTNTLPLRKLGIYMGIFNFFIVIPQLVAASILGLLVRDLFANDAMFGIVIGGGSMIIAGFTVLLVDKDAEPAG